MRATCQCGVVIDLDDVAGQGWVAMVLTWLPERGYPTSDWVLCKACLRAALDALEERCGLTVRTQPIRNAHGWISAAS